MFLLHFWSNQWVVFAQSVPFSAHPQTCFMSDGLMTNCSHGFLDRTKQKKNIFFQIKNGEKYIVLPFYLICNLKERFIP